MSFKKWGGPKFESRIFGGGVARSIYGWAQSVRRPMGGDVSALFFAEEVNRKKAGDST